jgi:2-haloacid dehalogenase
MKLGKHDILFVSSNAFDVIGAKAFGFRVCWINRTGAALDPLGPKPDFIVGSFNELVTALGERVPLGRGPSQSPDPRYTPSSRRRT